MFSAFCLLFSFFFFNDTATTEIYTLSLHDALPISLPFRDGGWSAAQGQLFSGAGRSAGPGAAFAKTLAGTGNGGCFAAAVGSRRAGKFRRNADGQSPGQLELHDFE